MKAPILSTLFGRGEVTTPPEIEAAVLRSDRFRLEREHEWTRLEDILSKDQYAYVSVDSQHAPLNEESLVAFCSMANDMGIHVQLRIKNTRQTYLIGNYLDLGPSGVEVPEVIEWDRQSHLRVQIVLAGPSGYRCCDLRSDDVAPTPEPAPARRGRKRQNRLAGRLRRCRDLSGWSLGLRAGHEPFPQAVELGSQIGIVPGLPGRGLSRAAVARGGHQAAYGTAVVSSSIVRCIDFTPALGPSRIPTPRGA